MLKALYSSPPARLFAIALVSIFVAALALYGGVEPRLRFSFFRVGLGLVLGLGLTLLIEAIRLALSKTKLNIVTTSSETKNDGIEFFERTTSTVFLETLVFRGLLFASLTQSWLLAHTVHFFVVMSCYALPASWRARPLFSRERIVEALLLAVEAILYAEAFRAGGLTLSASVYMSRIITRQVIREYSS